MNKSARIASNQFVSAMSLMSKQALIDTLWCACQLGTDESEQQIFTQAARNAVIALADRGDRQHPSISNAAILPIDSD